MYFIKYNHISTTLENLIPPNSFMLFTCFVLNETRSHNSVSNAGPFGPFLAVKVKSFHLGYHLVFLAFEKLVG